MTPFVQASLQPSLAVWPTRVSVIATTHGPTRTSLVAGGCSPVQPSPTHPSIVVGLCIHAHTNLGPVCARISLRAHSCECHHKRHKCVHACTHMCLPLPQNHPLSPPFTGHQPVKVGELCSKSFSHSTAPSQTQVSLICLFLSCFSSFLPVACSSSCCSRSFPLPIPSRNNPTNSYTGCT